MTKTGTPCAIGLQGDVVTAERPRVVFGDGATFKQFSPHSSRRIPGFPISDEVIQKLHGGRLDVLVDLLDKPSGSLSAFQKLLLHGVHLYGNAKVQAAAPDRFLTLTRCLEAFLITGEGNITQSIAEGTVVFFKVPLEERMRLKKDLQQHYRTRSKLSHGERAEILLGDLYQLEDIVKSFLVAMVEHRDQFKSKEDLVKFLEAQRLR